MSIAGRGQFFPFFITDPKTVRESAITKYVYNHMNQPDDRYILQKHYKHYKYDISRRIEKQGGINPKAKILENYPVIRLLQLKQQIRRNNRVKKAHKGRVIQIQISGDVVFYCREKIQGKKNDQGKINNQLITSSFLPAREYIAINNTLDREINEIQRIIIMAVKCQTKRAYFHKQKQYEQGVKHSHTSVQFRIS